MNAAWAPGNARCGASPARRRFLAGLAAGLAACAAAPGAAGAESLVVQDDGGARVTLAAPPRRIVSLLPSLTESVCVLKACDRLVGTDRFSSWPPEVLALPKLGGLEDAQIERIAALKPDLVLATPSARVVDRLRALGHPVLALASRTRGEVRASLETLARVLGRPEAAGPVWRHIEAQMRQAADRVPAALRGRRVYFEIDAAPYAAGAGSFVGETLEHLGLGNIASPALGPFPRLNPEFVVRAQPDIVIAMQRNLDEMPRRPGWAGLAALRDGQVCGFPPERYELLVRPGPRMGEAALRLADCLAALPRR